MASDRWGDVARWLSILGHPALLVPVAAAVALALAEPGPGRRATILLLPAAIALLTLAYAVLQVRRGAWVHVDASRPAERRGMQFVLLALFGGLALLLARQDAPPAWSAALLGAAIVVGVAVLAARWCKPSLHFGFALFAAALTWPHAVACAVLLGLALAVGWSRLRLRRHTRLDLAVAGVGGLLAGVAYVLRAT
jgi:hypothetical protein